MRANKSSHCQNCPSMGSGIFCDLQALPLDDLSRQKVTNIFKKGQTLFVDGNPAYGLYCISQGNIKISKVSNEGKDAIVRIAKAGDILGHRSIFTHQHYAATATAIEETKVCFIDKKYIFKRDQDEPTVAKNIILRL